MQLKVNRHRQRQEKKYSFTLSSPLLSPEFVYWTLWSPPPCSLLPHVASLHPLTTWRRYTILKMSSAGATEEAGEVKKYSFQIGFSFLFAIYWIALVHRAESAARWGRTRPSCGRKTIESVREEPKAHQINSSRRGEAGPGWGLGDTCASDGDYFPPLPASTFLILFSLAAHANYCELPEIGVTKGGWDQQERKVNTNILEATLKTMVTSC